MQGWGRGSQPGRGKEGQGWDEHVLREGAEEEWPCKNEEGERAQEGRSGRKVEQ